jgi:hypothetical protein
MKANFFVGFVFLGLGCLPGPGGIATCRAQTASEPSITQVERDFRELPMSSRRQCGPLFWLHGDDSRERLEQFVGKVAEGGNGAFTAESRPHNDWLGEGWFRDLAICLEAAKKQDLKLWIFDEKWWPSQSVGGKVPARYAAKRLVASAVDVEGPVLHQGDGYAGDGYIAALAGRFAADGAIEGSSLTDLASSIQDGKLRWQASAGRWKVMKFTYKLASGLGQSGGKELSVDGASKDCVDWYLRIVYQPHYDRFKADFGKTIVGYFYDEPETQGDWGTGLNPVLAENGVDWKRAYVAYKFQLSGGEQAAARYQYLEARAEAWGRTMYGGITRWCQARGVQSIGHFMEHANMYLRPDFCAGDLMRLQKYSSMGGIDAVFSQFKPGQRAAYDAPSWQTPKLGSSVTHAYGKPDDVTMVEIFGARGQDLSYPEMKWWADHMHASGVNFLIPHSFNPRAPNDTDCPPYFYMEQYEPRWPLYKVFAHYTSRLSVLLTGGRHVAPVALLFSGNTAQVGKAVTPEQISESLQDALYDCDWLPFEVFEKDTTVRGRELQLRAESYQVLVVPPAEVIPYSTLQKAKEFFDRGGTVLAHGYLPSQSGTLGHNAADIARLCGEIWGQPQPALAACRTNAAGGRSYLLPEKPTPEQLQQVLAGDAGILPALEILEGRTDHWLHVLHRVKAGRDVFFIANQNHMGAPRTFRFQVSAEGYPEIWDPMRNEVCAVPFRRDGPNVELSIEFQPNESALLVFHPTQRELPVRKVGGSLSPKRTYDLERVAVAAPQPPTASLPRTPAMVLEGGSWVWYPEAAAFKEAAPGPRWFRKTFELSPGRVVSRATFIGTADNAFTLDINGKRAGEGDSSAEGWRNPATLDVASLLRDGRNLLAIEAVNAATGTKIPNPAGLIGCLTVEFREGPPLLLRVDSSWKASAEKRAEWNSVDFDDSAWQAAKTTVKFGAAPWGKLGGAGITLGPVPADPYAGRVVVSPADMDGRFYLELSGLAPEEAARVTVNGQDAGGFISRPLRLDVTRWIKAGENSIRIEPFAPGSARLCVY